MTYTLKLFNTGQVTLPIKWRSNFNTKIFIAEEREDGLLIKPIIDGGAGPLYYESKDGFGIYSDEGINPNKIISKIKELNNE